MGSIVLIGLGNAMRGDDGVGLWVARQIQARHWSIVRALPLGFPDPLDLAQAWAGASIAWLVDAVVATAPPGAIRRIPWERLATDPRAPRFSSHGLPLPEAVAIARMQGDPPQRIILYGIVGQDFGYGERLTPAVERGAHRLLQRLERMLLRIRCEGEIRSPADPRREP